MSDYDWYFKALEVGNGHQLSREQQQILGITHEPQPGFYRRRNKQGSDVPVAIWPGDDGLVAKVGSDFGKPDEVWTWCCQHPVSENVYRAVAEEGKLWPDDPPIAEATIGHNSGSDDPHEALSDQIAAAKACVPDFASIEDDERQAQAQSARARLNELSGEADKTRKREKEPHLEAGRAVDAKWQPLVKEAKAGADEIAKSMSAYETKKARKKQEEEAARMAAEIAARKEAEKNDQPAPEPIPQSEPEPTATTIKGGYGRAASVRVVKIATVVDQDKAYQSMRTHPEIRDLIAKLAQRAVDKGHEIDGVTVEEERKVA